MSDTRNFAMPLLDAAQAQKHVTVNEAIVRADALAARQVQSRSESVPPATPADGSVYIVGASASDDWAEHDFDLALFLNGGWAFVAPWEGAHFWIVDEAVTANFIGGTWILERISNSTGGAYSFARVIEVDHELAAAPSSITPNVIPDKAIVLGVTGRVIQEITGANDWSLGVPGSVNRYGTGYGTGLGAFAHGVTGQPQAYFGATPIEITSNGPAFTGGLVRLAVHLLELSPPNETV
ncbi:MAG: DUF2793 domain-containing protein [Paracoccaceae bacterium]